MAHPHLLHPDDYASFDWPSDPDTHLTRQWLTFWATHGTQGAITNARVDTLALVLDSCILPVTITHGQRETCYVAGPYANFIDYAREELHTLESRALRQCLGAIISGMGTLLRPGDVNRIVMVNNYLLSTNLYPALTSEQIVAATQILTDAFPGYAVAFRSVSNVGDRPLTQQFLTAHYLPVPSRQVWWQIPGEPLSRNAKKCLKRDFKLLDAGPYQVVNNHDLTENDMPHLLDLYNQLYLQKYTPLNPQFTLAFLTEAWRNQLLFIQALRHRETGRIDGVMGCFWRQGMLTTPLFGYDTTLPAERGLYRMLAGLVYREAEARQLIAHCSSGAAEFKRSRGARPAIEYLMVYTHHLKPVPRVIWSVLGKLLQRLAVPIMMRYEL